MVSCSDDDNNSSSNVTASNLAKKWYYVSDKVNGTVIPYDDDEPCGRDYMEFFTNGKVVSADVASCDGNTPVYESIEAPYTISGNVVTITLMGFELEGKVLELTSNKLVVESHYEFDEDDTVDTVITTYSSQP